jgi:hypothetical protein
MVVFVWSTRVQGFSHLEAREKQGKNREKSDHLGYPFTLAKTAPLPFFAAQSITRSGSSWQI